MAQGIAVNAEDPEPKLPDEEVAEGEEGQNKTAEFVAKDPMAQYNWRQKHNKMVKDKKGKYHQKIIGNGLSKEVWNEESEDYESSFKAYVRQQNEKKGDDDNMFVFDLEGGKDNELVMNKNNTKVMWTLAICALVGGVVAGFMIRYLMRVYFPEEEQAPIINHASVRTTEVSEKESPVKPDTERESFPMRSTKASFELS